MAFELIEDKAPSEQEESWGSTALRGAARTASRVGEQIAGLPGDIFSLINDYIAAPLSERITGQPSVEYEKTHLGKILPPTEKHRKATTKAFGKYIEPQNDVEKFIDNIFTDATSLAVPGLKGAKLGSKALKALAISTAANTVGAGVEDITANESKAGIAKLGSMFMLSMLDKPKAAQAVAELYKPLSVKVTQLAPVDAGRLSNSLHNLQNKVSKGTMAPSEKFIFDEAGAILSKIKNGQITPEEIWAVKRSLNEKLIKTLFETPDKYAQGRARKLAKHILRETDSALSQTAKQDPKFYKDLKSADKAFGVIADSNYVSKYLEKNMKYTPLNHGLVELLKGSTGSNLGGATVAYGAVKILHRISKSPVLAKHYAKVLSSAAAQNSVVMNRELKKLDKGLEEEKNNDRFSLID